MVEQITYLRVTIIEDLQTAADGKRLTKAQRKLFNEAADEIRELRLFIAQNGKAWARLMGEMTRQVWSEDA